MKTRCETTIMTDKKKPFTIHTNIHICPHPNTHRQKYTLFKQKRKKINNKKKINRIKNRKKTSA